MDVPGGIISALITGVIIGGLGRLVVPGRQAIGCIFTVLVGLVGAFGGYAIARALGIDSAILTFLLQVGAAAILVAIVAAAQRSANRPGPPGPWPPGRLREGPTTTAEPPLGRSRPGGRDLGHPLRRAMLRDRPPTLDAPTLASHGGPGCDGGCGVGLPCRAWKLVAHPQRLRATRVCEWMFAAARNGCVRRCGARGSPSPSSGKPRATPRCSREWPAE